MKKWEWPGGEATTYTCNLTYRYLQLGTSVHTILYDVHCRDVKGCGQRLNKFLSLEGGALGLDVRGRETCTLVRLCLNRVEGDLEAPAGEEKEGVVRGIHLRELMDVLWGRACNVNNV